MQKTPFTSVWLTNKNIIYPKKSEANYDFQELFLHFLLNNRTCMSYVKSVEVTEKDKKGGTQWKKILS